MFIILYLFLSIYFFLKGIGLLYEKIEKILILKNLEFEKEINRKEVKSNKITKKHLKETISFPKLKDRNNININSTNKIYSEIKLIPDFNLSKENININKMEEKEISSIHNDYEINSFSFKEAIKKDKRTFFKYIYLY